ncbi:hypothetical protein [Halorussus ruber]|uniref:hypothetical protein n=1 Tax=Halorussus ruber TaxID=1126238 RepID=UPI001092BB7C|nr:hypothetical protein [Halorussus ruber]
MVPLFLGLPGGMELLVVLLVAVILFGIPLVLLGGGLYLYRSSQSESAPAEEIEALREEVRQLREEIRESDDER